MKQLRFFEATGLIVTIILGLVGCQSMPSTAPAAEVSAKVAPPSRSISTFEGNAEVIEIGMGVSQVEFWKRLQLVIGHPEWMTDFPKIVDALNLQLTDSIYAVDPSIEKTQIRQDLKSKIGRSYFLDEKSFYGVIEDYPKKGKLYKTLNLHFTSLAICISANEIERVLGPGEKSLIVQSHRSDPREALKNPLGYAHGITYKDAKNLTRTAFSISPSGCATGMSIRQEFN